MIKIDLLAETRLGPTPVIGGDTSHDTPEHLTKKYIIIVASMKKNLCWLLNFLKCFSGFCIVFYELHIF
jgi:hypothetical protein